MEESDRYIPRNRNVGELRRIIKKVMPATTAAVQMQAQHAHQMLTPSRTIEGFESGVTPTSDPIFAGKKERKERKRVKECCEVE